MPIHITYRNGKKCGLCRDYISRNLIYDNGSYIISSSIHKVIIFSGDNKSITFTVKESHELLINEFIESINNLVKISNRRFNRISDYYSFIIHILSGLTMFNESIYDDFTNTEYFKKVVI